MPPAHAFLVECHSLTSCIHYHNLDAEHACTHHKCAPDCTVADSLIFQTQKGRSLRIPSSQACPSPRTPNQQDPAVPNPKKIEDTFKGYRAEVERVREVAWVLFSSLRVGNSGGNIISSSVGVHISASGDQRASSRQQYDTNAFTRMKPSTGFILVGPRGTGRYFFPTGSFACSVAPTYNFQDQFHVCVACRRGHAQAGLLNA